MVFRIHRYFSLELRTKCTRISTTANVLQCLFWASHCSLLPFLRQCSISRLFSPIPNPWPPILKHVSFRIPSSIFSLSHCFDFLLPKLWSCEALINRVYPPLLLRIPGRFSAHHNKIWCANPIKRLWYRDLGGPCQNISQRQPVSRFLDFVYDSNNDLLQD